MTCRNLSIACEIELRQAAALPPFADVAANGVCVCHARNFTSPERPLHDLRGNRPSACGGFDCGIVKRKETVMTNLIRPALLIDAAASAATAALAIAGARMLEGLL